MLEGVVSNLLNRVLGLYVKNFDPKHLSVGIWNGDVKLTDLELRKEALDQLELPLNVVEGHIGVLTMSIPWSNLRGKAVKINIEDIFILAAPREDADYNPEEDEKRKHGLKMEKLESAELLKERNTEGMSKEEQAKQQGFAASMTTAIIDNLQVTIKNIHVRYEDSISDPGHPFAAGLTLRGFSAISTDGSWRPTFIQSTSDSTHKLAKLSSLAIYWDTDTKLLGTGLGSEVGSEKQGIDHDEMLNTFRKMIVQEEGDTTASHQYILKPVTGSMGIEMDKSGKTDRPQMKARVFFDELGFLLDEDQYRDALMLVDLFHYFMRQQEYKKLQPKTKPKEDPRAWLRFAGQAVLDRIHDRNRRWSWDYFKERRDDRKRYIELFKKKKKEEKLTADETNALDKLEHKLEYEDLRFWRSLARNELRKENALVKKSESTKQGWGSWVWHGGRNPDAQTKAKADDDSQMTEQQRKELYAAIDYDEKKALTEAVDLPPNSIKLQVHLALKTGSFTLKRDPHGKSADIMQLLFDNFNTSFIQRPESMLVKLSLHGMHLHDGTTPATLYPEIINVKNASGIPDGERVEEIHDDNDAEKKSSSATNQAPELELSPEKLLDAKDEELEKTFENTFFSVMFEQNPLDGHADSAVNVKLQGMEIVSNPKFVTEVAKFFKPPERQMESIGALMDTAGATVEGLRQQTRAGLEFALTEHKTIDVQLDLQAPLIIIPDSVTQESSLCLILDAGHISVNSELIDKDTINEMQSRQHQKLSEDELQQLQSLMYDKFSLKLESTQVLIGPSIKETRAQLNASGEESRDLHLIDRINMQFMIETCILPKDTDLTKFRVSGNLPVLHASVSDSKYKGLMRLLEVAIPKFDDEVEPSASKAIADRPSAPQRRKSSRRQSRPAEDGKEVRARAKSFQFSAQESELVMEEDADEMKQAEFQDAQSGQDGVNIHQKNFEFKFVVEKLQASLYRSDPDGKNGDKLLAEFVAEEFRLDFYQRAFDMVADVSLRAITLEDHVEQAPMPEFKNIVSSEDSSSDSTDLLQVRFQKVNPDSPEFQSVHEGIATNLDVDVSTINLVITRRTLLTLLDFVLVTFASSDTNASTSDSLSEDESSDLEVVPAEQAPSTDRIRIKAELKRIAVILNDDGIRLATLSLNTASVGLMLTGKTMRVGAKLGNVLLVDDVNTGVSEKSSLRQLVSIEGEELADFSYETYDPESEVYPGHDSSIYLRAGSLKVNFVTEPFRKIMEFAVKFGKMQAVFNAAREAAANRAEQMQDRANKMQFDIIVSTPIIVFPRTITTEGLDRDTVTAYLGEIYAQNKFVPIDDSEHADTANALSAGLRNVRLATLINYHEKGQEELELIDKVDIGFDVNYVEHKPDQNRPDLEVRGNMSDINLKVTPPQLKFILELSRTIPAAFATESDSAVDDKVQEELPDSTVEQAKQITSGRPAENTSAPHPPSEPAHQAPELETSAEKWTKVDLVFKSGTVGLELLEAKDDRPMGDASAASLSKFSINDINVKLRMVSDGSLEAELLIQSFTVTDTRKRGTNKFRKIMSLTNTDITQQFMANVTMSGGEDKNMMAVLSVDSPRVILSLEFLFAVQAFMNASLATDELDQDDEDEEEQKQIEMDTDSDENESQQGTLIRKGNVDAGEAQGGMTMSFRVSLVDAQAIVIANPASANSEAIVLGLKQAVVAKQHATTLQAEKIGIFLCRMDRFESNHLRILDDFSITTSLDIRGQQGEESSMTNIHVDIEPLVLRLSLRDILLVMQIFQRAAEMSRSVVEDDEHGEQEIAKLAGAKTSGKRPAPSKRRSSAGKKTAKSIKARRPSVKPPVVAETTEAQGSTILKREELDLHMGGIRVVLIGDTHELPIFDWSVDKFDVSVHDWSGAMTADTSLDTFINVYNFSKSAWEPLVEPWNIALHMAKELKPARLSIDVFSRKQLDITMTTSTIALASKSFDFLSTDEDVLAKPRGNDAPYRIRNFTGFVLNVWTEKSDGHDGPAARVEDGDEAPWHFEDATTTREKLSAEAAAGVVAVKLDSTGFDSIERIPINKEGEVLYNLLPRKDKVLHRLLVEVELGTDNVKYVTFRSPLTIENASQIPIEIGVYSPDEGHLLRVEKIAPGQCRPSPVGAAFMHSLVVRPDPGFGYTWSNERLFWKDILKRPTQVITCRGEDQETTAPPFYFQMNAIYDKTNPITK